MTTLYLNGRRVFFQPTRFVRAGNDTCRACRKPDCDCPDLRWGGVVPEPA